MSWVTSPAVAAGQRHLQRDTVPFGDQMVFRASSGTSTGLGPVLGRLSSPAGASRRSPPSTSPVGRRRSTRRADSRAAAARLRPRSRRGAAASRSYPIQNPTPGARTPRQSRYGGRTGCRTGPCGHPVEDGPDGRCAEAQRPATAARSALTARQTRSTVAADPSSRPDQQPRDQLIPRSNIVESADWWIDKVFRRPISSFK